MTIYLATTLEDSDEKNRGGNSYESKIFKASAFVFLHYEIEIGYRTYQRVCFDRHD